MHTLRDTLWNPHTRVPPFVEGFLMLNSDDSWLFAKKAADRIFAETPLL
jgi:hypothetical protein